jgi:hypothetical protein
MILNPLLDKPNLIKSSAFSPISPKGILFCVLIIMLQNLELKNKKAASEETAFYAYRDLSSVNFA